MESGDTAGRRDEAEKEEDVIGSLYYRYTQALAIT
jgi:hypothetical protein